MGRPKALLDFHGKTFIEEILNNLAAAAISPILIVTSGSNDIKCRLQSTINADWTFNPHPEDGMLSSFRCGIRALGPEKRNIMLCLVDHPAVKLETYKALASRATRDRIVIPVYKGRRGHPVVFGSLFVRDLLEGECAEGARSVIRAHPEAALEVHVDDPGVTLDIDTPDEYEKLGETL